jgi:hypothetical protein
MAAEIRTGDPRCTAFVVMSQLLTQHFTPRAAKQGNDAWQHWTRAATRKDGSNGRPGQQQTGRHKQAMLHQQQKPQPNGYSWENPRTPQHKESGVRRTEAERIQEPRHAKRWTSAELNKSTCSTCSTGEARSSQDKYSKRSSHKSVGFWHPGVGAQQLQGLCWTQLQSRPIRVNTPPWPVATS